MSDCVRDLSANAYEGGFVFRITNAALNDNHPFTTSQQKLIEYCRRVKLWSLSTDFTMTDSLGATFAMTNGTIPQIFGMPTREREMLVGSNLESVAQWSWATSYTNDIASFQLFQDGAGGRLFRNAGNLYPYLNVVATIFNNTLAESVALVSLSSGGAFALNGTIDTIEFPLYVTIDGTPQPTYTVSNFDLTPVEWWPYAALSDGSPIYDTSTGAQLQDPRN